jgi:hypothetical protein
VVKTTTLAEGCDTWWMPGSDAKCGEFVLDVPKGARLALRALGTGGAQPPEMGYLPGLGRAFVAGEQPYHILVLAQVQLASALKAAWGVEQAADTGLLAGIVAKWDPDATPIYTELVGGATVAVKPAVAGSSVFYFDSSDPGSSALEASDPAQPLFFAWNLPPRGVDDPYVAETRSQEYLFDDISFPVEAGALTFIPVAPSGVAGEVEVQGRIWSYWASGASLEYDYPQGAVKVHALTGGSDPVATTSSNTDDCTPWSPGDVYMCGTFSLTLDAGQEVMLKASGYQGYKNTLSRIFEVAPNEPQILVMVQEGVVDLLGTTWQMAPASGKGHVAGIVAAAEGGIADAPFKELVGGATVEVTPAPEGGPPTVVYYDSANPTSTTLEATDAAQPIFVVLNLEPRPFANPYQIVVSHPEKAFEAVRFAVEADTLTYLILSPTD